MGAAHGQPVEGRPREAPRSRSPRVLVLGPLAVHHDGEVLQVAGTHRRRLLALLASRVGEAVSVDAIVDALWGEASPPSAAKTIQSHMTRLRRSLAGLGPDVIVTVPGGYRLDLDPDEVDAARFERDAHAAHDLLAEGHLRDASALLDEVLALWRGPAYLELDDAEFARAERARLEELRHRALEDQCEVRLSSGQAGSAVADLEGLARVEPGRERVWALLMRALYADGRQQDALDVARRAERALREAYGLEPGPALRALEQQILQQDPGLDPLTVRLPAGLRTDSPLIGRRAELDYLALAWTAAREGRGQVCLLDGEVDSGRTRLAAELAARAVEDGAVVAYHRAEVGLGAEPGAAVDAIVAASRTSPQLVIVDDAEWADRATVAAIDALADACTHLSALVVVIVDSRAGGPAIDALDRLEARGARRLPLGPMSDADLVELAGREGVDSSEVSAVVALADGRPGVARREAVAWVEQAASTRLHQAARSSAAAADEAGRAWGAVTEEIRALIRARNRHDALVNVAWRGRQPYRSLASYGPEDAEIFVGRERAVAEVAARLLEHRVVLVVGPSGSGKSSLLRAGLIPLVASGQLPGEPVRSVQVRTGADDLSAAVDVDRAEAQLLVVDQLEDLFNAEPEVRDAGAAALVELAGDAALDVRIVLALRADAYGRLTEVPELAQLAQDAHVLVGPPTVEEIRRIVEVPARRTGCEVEPRLVDLVAADMADDPGALPLLSAALAEVWEHRDDDTLRAATYTELGGLAVSVERLGDRVLTHLGPDRTRLARSALLRLVDVSDDGEWHRVRVPGAAFDQDEARVLDALAGARLVERRGDDVEITHEVVLRAWPQLVAWLDEVRLDRVADRQLRAAARSWEASSRSADDLYRGGRLELAEARAAAAPSVAPVVAAFLTASRTRADQEAEEAGARLAREVRAHRRSNRLLAGVATLLVVALVAAGLAVVATRSANDARSEALDARDGERSARLVAESDGNLDTHLDLALLLAAEAWRREDSPATQGALFSALTHNVSAQREREGASQTSGGSIRATPSSFAGYLSGPSRGATDVDVSDDGRIVATSGIEGDADEAVLIVHDVETRRELLRQVLPGKPGTVEISSDGSTVAAVAGSSLVLFDLRTGTTTTVGAQQLGTGPIVDASMRPGHHQIAIGDGEGTIRLWDWDRDATIETRLPSANGRFGFQPDGVLAMAIDYGGGPGIALWNIDGQTADALVPLEPPEASDWAGFSVSSDGGRLVGAERAGRLYLWDLRTGLLEGEAANRPGTVQGVAFSPVGGLLAVSGSDGDVVLYDPVTDRPIGDQLHAHSGRVLAPAFSADGELMVTAADDGMIGLWETNRSGGLLATGIVSDARGMVHSTDGNQVLVVDQASGVAERRPANALGDPGTALPALAGRNGLPLGPNADGSRAVMKAGVQGDAEMYVVTTGLDGKAPRTVWRDQARRYRPEGTLSPDGGRLVTLTSDLERVVVIDVDAGREVASIELTDAVPGQFRSFGGPILSLDGRVVDVATSNGVARLSADDLSVIRSVRSPFPIQGFPVAIPGTDDLVVVGASGELARWNMDRGEIVATGRTGDPSPGGALAVSPDGTVLATYGYQSYRLGLFDLATLAPIGRPMPVGDLIFIPGFTPDGRGLTGNGLFNAATTWTVDPDEWFDRACRAAGRNLTAAEWFEHLGPEEPYRPTCDQWPAAT